LVARMARLSLDVAEGVPTPSKHVNDFLRLNALIEPEQIQSAWAEHRKPKHPERYADAANLLENLVVAHPELLVSPTYSRNVEELCPRCVSTSSFNLAPPSLMLSLLGYC